MNSVDNIQTSFIPLGFKFTFDVCRYCLVASRFVIHSKHMRIMFCLRCYSQERNQMLCSRLCMPWTSIVSMVDMEDHETNDMEYHCTKHTGEI